MYAKTIFNLPIILMSALIKNLTVKIKTLQASAWNVMKGMKRLMIQMFVLNNSRTVRATMPQEIA